LRKGEGLLGGREGGTILASKRGKRGPPVPLKKAWVETFSKRERDPPAKKEKAAAVNREKEEV